MSIVSEISYAGIQGKESIVTVKTDGGDDVTFLFGCPCQRSTLTLQFSSSPGIFKREKCHILDASFTYAGRLRYSVPPPCVQSGQISWVSHTAIVMHSCFLSYSMFHPIVTRPATSSRAVIASGLTPASSSSLPESPPPGGIVTVTVGRPAALKVSVTTTPVSQSWSIGGQEVTV